MRRQKFHSYWIQFVQELQGDGTDRRVQYCEWFKPQRTRAHDAMFSDKAGCHGVVSVYETDTTLVLSVGHSSCRSCPSGNYPKNNCVVRDTGKHSLGTSTPARWSKRRTISPGAE
jgi:hypothetical protein